jgi:hypothetical protein
VIGEVVGSWEAGGANGGREDSRFEISDSPAQAGRISDSRFEI